MTSGVVLTVVVKFRKAIPSLFWRESPSTTCSASLSTVWKAIKTDGSTLPEQSPSLSSVVRDAGGRRGFTRTDNRKPDPSSVW